jgi:hypothetical protein
MPDSSIEKPRGRPPSVVVTARHCQPLRATEERRPWGTVHVRMDGCARTFCGLSTLEWASFWGEVLEPADPNSCKDCVRILHGFPSPSSARNGGIATP